MIELMPFVYNLNRFSLCFFPVSWSVLCLQNYLQWHNSGFAGVCDSPLISQCTLGWSFEFWGSFFFRWAQIFTKNRRGWRWFL